MGKRSDEPRNNRKQAVVSHFNDQPDVMPQPRSVEPIEAKTPAQKRYIAAIKGYTLSFGVGPAGTGKTWLATALAAQALMNKEVEHVIITRPAVEAGENLGFLPGELEEKFDPYLDPFRQTLNERLGRAFAEYLIKTGRIEAVPLAYMRGRTFKRALVILDEAQNTTPTQMKMFLTRIGEDCKVIVNGDPEQVDIKGPSGLEDAIARCSHIPAVRVVRFSRDDVVRSGLCAEIVQAYVGPAPTSSYGSD